MNHQPSDYIVRYFLNFSLFGNDFIITLFILALSLEKSASNIRARSPTSIIFFWFIYIVFISFDNSLLMVVELDL